MRYIFLLLTTFVFGDAISQPLRARINSEHNYSVPVPEPVTFVGSSTLINTSMGSSITQAELGAGITNALVPNPYEQRLQVNGLVGTYTAYYNWKSEVDNIRSWIGGDIITSSQIIQGVTGSPISNYHYWSHLGIVGDSDSLVNGITGAYMSATPGGTFVKYSDVVVKNVAFAGFRVNDSDSTRRYAKIDTEFIRTFGYSVEGEGCYFGGTSPANFSPIDTLLMYHSFFTNKGRDGQQVNVTNLMQSTNTTVYNVGIENASAQRSLLQLQNVVGTQDKSLFAYAPKLFVVAANGLTIKNSVFIFDEQGDLQDLVIDAGYDPGNGQPVNFENCYFFCTGNSGTITHAFDIGERTADINIINCFRNSNITTAIGFDGRGGGATNTITETGTTVYDNVPAPIFNSLDPDNDNSGLLLNYWYLSRGIGFRSVN